MHPWLRTVVCGLYLLTSLSFASAKESSGLDAAGFLPDVRVQDDLFSRRQREMARGHADSRGQVELRFVYDLGRPLAGPHPSDH